MTDNSSPTRLQALALPMARAGVRANCYPQSNCRVADISELPVTRPGRSARVLAGRVWRDSRLLLRRPDAMVRERMANRCGHNGARYQFGVYNKSAPRRIGL